ncbi:response regulator transcription factor [Sphingomonas sp. AP4-R1]|uniref:response regulator transcription factor n=1 Tax=Sphingomonas sp. AP4-R1 TaxID=2735134 RepID=UPI00149330A7|nr:response regulator transcription factor [Sphingomonas sp. AP4-R1]QJU59081.1 response regulator transcription factor [Sphingomonas sp. AP4-R1]
MRVLLVEDDRELAAHVRARLEKQDHVVVVAEDGADGSSRAIDGDFDVVILDRMLPRMDGISALKAMRAGGVLAPVLMLTARGSIEDRVEGLDAGADDYLIKPFALAELAARVSALGRRSRAPDHDGIVAIGSIRLDRVDRSVTRAGKAIPLHPREFQLLDMLMRHGGRVVTRAMLLKAIWRFDFDPETKIVESHMSRLRAKLDGGFATGAIETIRGEGYRVRGDA